MTLKKGRLTVRKNSHSKAQSRRAKDRREARKLKGQTLYVLDRLNLRVESYYSCEIDRDALEIQKFRFGERIHALGDVRSLTEEKLQSIGCINLLIGGSPCSDLSLVNHRRRGLHDSHSTGVLLYEYVRVRDYLQSRAKKDRQQFFWLYENTSHMEYANRHEISKNLHCQPVRINASDFLPVKRSRLFWSNVPDIEKTPKHDSGKVSLEDILPFYRNGNVSIVLTLTTTSHSQKSGKGQQYPVTQEGEPSSLFITEREALFGLPESFTDGPNLSISRRRCLLGKAICVPVIQHILKPLTELFACKFFEGMSEVH